MTELLEHPESPAPKPATIEKVSIIISKGSLEGIYPGLIMANGARMEGIDANLFFTFFGMDAINKAKHEHVKVATVGNPGLHLATWAGGFPGISTFITHKLAGEMEKVIGASDRDRAAVHDAPGVVPGRVAGSGGLVHPVEGDVQPAPA
jgi:peroxiredoxin family protein